MIILLVIMVFTSTFFIYYVDIIVSIAFENMRVRTKKEFKKCFIPYYRWIKKIKDFYNKLEDK